MIDGKGAYFIPPNRLNKPKYVIEPDHESEEPSDMGGFKRHEDPAQLAAEMFGEHDPLAYKGPQDTVTIPKQTWLSDLDIEDSDAVNYLAEKLLAEALTRNGGRLKDIAIPDYDALSEKMIGAIKHRKSNTLNDPEDHLVDLANSLMQKQLAKNTSGEALANAEKNANLAAFKNELFSENIDIQKMTKTLLNFVAPNWKDNTPAHLQEQALKALVVEIMAINRINPSVAQRIKDAQFEKLMIVTKKILSQ